MDQQELYEEFHRDTAFLKRIPQADDFCMRNHLPIYQKYIRSTDSVLDIGCGGGAFSLAVASLGATVKGVDLSSKAIIENRKAAQFHGLDNLTFANDDFMTNDDVACYDVVMLTEVLEHLPDDRMALSKVGRLIQKNGYLLMSVPSVNAPLHRKYIKKYGRDPFDERVGHLRRYCAVEVFNLLHLAGFELVEFRLCEGYLRNWLFNDPFGRHFMRFNRWIVTKIVSFIDDFFVTPLLGESDIVIIARKI